MYTSVMLDWPAFQLAIKMEMLQKNRNLFCHFIKTYQKNIFFMPAYPQPPLKC